MKKIRRRLLAAVFVVAAIAATVAWLSVPPRYDPIERVLPEWFSDAKFGIFIHWGLFSVPSYGPAGKGSVWEVAASEGVSGQLKNNPYAEWYLNSLLIEGSPTQAHHRATYGTVSSYDDLVPVFNREIEQWNPEQWARLFEEAGAKYVVQVTKHHDGFLLWPSEHPSPSKKGYFATRDTVGELTEAVRALDMKMGLYYSGGLDWTFNPPPITDPASYLTNAPQSNAYADYATGHFKELIDRYRPDILWNDICFPRRADVRDLFDYYYEQVPEGVINDRWLQYPPVSNLAGWPGIRAVVNFIGNRLVKDHDGHAPMPFHADFTTPEYRVFPDIQAEKWETCRGIGQSFGYNQMETADDYLTADEAVRMLVDVVSKNGNLLLNVGPQADGAISQEQVDCLLGIGAWLQTNGDAIYGTRPWKRAEGKTTDGIEVRFTQKNNALFAILLEAPKSNEIEVLDLQVEPEASIQLLGHDAPLSWSRQGNNLKVTLPGHLRPVPAYTLRISTLGE